MLGGFFKNAENKVTPPRKLFTFVKNLFKAMVKAFSLRREDDRNFLLPNLLDGKKDALITVNDGIKAKHNDKR